MHLSVCRMIYPMVYISICGIRTNHLLKILRLIKSKDLHCIKYQRQYLEITKRGQKICGLSLECSVYFSCQHCPQRVLSDHLFRGFGLMQSCEVTSSCRLSRFLKSIILSTYPGLRYLSSYIFYGGDSPEYGA